MQSFREYKLEIKRIVDYSRCRLYRSFIQNLIADRSIRTNGCSGLFHFVDPCSYANFRTSYRRPDGITYTVHPGEWVCRMSKLQNFLRLRSKRQVLVVLRDFQEHNLIRFSVLGQKGGSVKYSIRNWARFNSTMFQISDIQIDKAEVALRLNIKKGKREGIGKAPALYCLELCCGEKELAYSFELTITEAHAGQGEKYCG